MSSSDISDARLSTDGGIKYKLVQGPTFDVDDQGATSKEKYLIAASDVAAFLAEAIPPAQLVNGFVQRPARRRMPGTQVFVTEHVHAEPHSNEKPGDPLGFDSNAASGTYNDLYAVDISYRVGLESEDNEPDPNDPSTFLEHSVNVSGEFLTVNPQDLCYMNLDVNSVGDAQILPYKKADIPMAKIHAMIEHNFRWPFALKPKWDTIIQSLGCVNDASVKLTDEFTLNPFTGLFVGISGQRRYIWTGTSNPNVAPVKISPWSLDYKILQKEIKDGSFQGTDQVWSWNHVWIDEEQGYREILRNCSSAGQLYRAVDYLDLFKSAIFIP